MDGLSAAASIIAVIQIAQAVASGLKQYYEALRDARHDIQKPYYSAGPLKPCQAELEKFYNELGTSSHRGKPRRGLRSLIWPFKKQDVEKRIVVLERYKSSLGLGLGVENFSTVIDHIQKTANDIDTAVVYWYFTSACAEKQNIANALSSLIADICITTDGFDNLYLVMDALDECSKANNQRETLLDLLHESLGSFLDQSPFVNVNVQGSHIEQDILKFLGHRLEHQSFRTWNRLSKEDVKKQLAKQANGMFRLVALQLDALSRIRTQAKIRTAVVVLPRSLDAYYDRILEEIEDPGDRTYAWRAFLLIAYSARPITLEKLAEAIVILSYNRTFSLKEAQLLHRQKLLRIIPASLISVVPSSADAEHRWLRSFFIAGDDGLVECEDSRLTAQFAHCSVKEYLLSNRTSASSIQQYQLAASMANRKIVAVCFTYLLTVGKSIPVTGLSFQICTEFPLLTYTAHCWTYHMQQLTKETPSANLKQAAVEFMQYEANSLGDYDRRPVHPITWASVTGLASLLQTIPQRPNIDLNAITATLYLRKPIYAEARVKRYGTVRILSDHGANVNEVKFSPLIRACEGYSADRDIPLVQTPMSAGASINARELLLKEGVDVSDDGGPFGTTLLTAAHRGHEQVVRSLIRQGRGGFPGIIKLLVEAGADINATGHVNPRTPLRIAVIELRDDCVQALFEWGTMVIDRKEWDKTYLESKQNLWYQSRLDECVRAIVDVEARSSLCATISIHGMLRDYAMKHGISAPELQSDLDLCVLGLIKHLGETVPQSQSPMELGRRPPKPQIQSNNIEVRLGSNEWHGDNGLGATNLLEEYEVGSEFELWVEPSWLLRGLLNYYGETLD
ncbi:uncharacterized protein PAC_00303 [Phialocephala subalpina]|uniref:Uncharacterized protein n=1 Tax=Phialocephala subalpina TaxID=576137 RepID=A0A1L7WCC1_9HELO|nr:uncharacterized protein PAC_00303 [Phialocephala subalpina]